MFKSLVGEKIAVLVANGFCEEDFTLMQRALQGSGANIRVISMDSGLVNSWNGSGWGLHFASDSVLSSALAADFSMLIIPGGQRSADKLKLTAHTRRFIGGFIDAQKPVVAMDEAVDLLVFAERMSGRTVSGPDDLREAAERAGATWSENPVSVCGNLMSASTATLDKQAFAEQAAAFLSSSFEMDQAA